MAIHQLTERRGDRHIAGQTAGIDPKQPGVFAAQFLSADGIQTILKMLGGGLEDSATMEIVDPASGHFFQQPRISAPGGTDVPRP
jgi:hypothetical protein